MILLVALTDDASVSLKSRFALRKRLSEVGDSVIFLAGPIDAAQLEALRTGLTQNSIRSAALLKTTPDPGMLWVAAEWWGRLVVDRSILGEIEPALALWVYQGSYRNETNQLDLAIFTPNPEGTQGQISEQIPSELKPEFVRVSDPIVFQERLDDEEACVLRVDSSAIRRNPKKWFGDLADERVGGANALLAHMREMDDGTILLPNLTLAFLDRETALASLAELTDAGGLIVRSAGFSRDQIDATNWYTAAPFKSSRNEFLDNLRDSQTAANYAVALEIEAPDDPEVIIGSGVVFEQLTLNGIQNLATVPAQVQTIAAGQIVPMILPAWCINRSLQPPSGQQMRLTRLHSKAGHNQSDVWTRIESALENAGLRQRQS